MKNKLTMLLLLSGLFLLGCDSIKFTSDPASVDDNTTNIAPSVNAGLDKETVVGQSVEITGVVVRVGSGEIVGYEWRDEAGQLLSGLKSFTYTPSAEGNNTFTFTATDDNDLNGSDSMVLKVTDN